MAGHTQDEILSRTEVLTKGIRNNLCRLKIRGIDETFATRVETLRDQVVRLEFEQSGLRSRLKEKTSEVNSSMSDLKAVLSEARILVKLQIPQTGWKEFGISDKK